MSIENNENIENQEAEQIITKDTVITSDLLIKRGKYANSDCEKTSKIFAIIILAVFPLLIGLNGYSDITQTKFYCFLVLTIIYLAYMCFALILDIKALPKGLKKTRFTKPDLPQIFILSYVIWACISSLMSSYSDIWLGQSRYEGLCSLLLYAVIFLLLSFFGEFSNIYIYSMAIMSIIFGSICLLQSFGVPIFFSNGYSYWDTSFLGTIGNIDCVAGIISLVVPVLFCAFILLKNRVRWLCIPGLVLMIYTQVFSDVDSSKLAFIAFIVVIMPFLIGTRQHTTRFLTVSAISLATIALTRTLNTQAGNGQILWSLGKLEIVLFAIAIILVGISIFLDKKKIEWKHSQAKIRKVTYISLGVLALLTLIAVFLYTGNNTLLSNLSNFLHGNLTDDAGSNRGIIWKNCIELIKQMPIFGSGAGTFLERYYPFNIQGQVADLAHNDFLQIGVCLGLVGLAIYIAFLVSLFIRALKVASRCPTVIILLSGCIGYIVWSAFVFSIAITTPPFWVLAGILDKCIKQIPPITDIKTNVEQQTS